MKKLLLLAILAVSATKVFAQTVALTMISSPCDSNGVVVATFTGMTPPFYDYWINGGTGGYHIVTAATDTFYNFTGGGISVTAEVGPSPYPFDSIFVALPFVVTVTNSPAVCPGLPVLSASATGGTPPYTYKWLSAPALTLASTANPLTPPTKSHALVDVVAISSACSGPNPVRAPPLKVITWAVSRID